ncbi:hypothetical protein CCH79_00018652 [Gambusia affinis]|uniref:ADP-ribosylation factor-like protein 4C n=2 Tax=Gambusia affinis TaxID=33528 RepID=A0A315V7G3_GAMAF|nr:hypothetical protein CCH79_00018652 [Gambusia affinis]
MGNSFSNISAFQSLHIVMLGLDSAGKTTVLYRLKFNEFVNTVPTIGFNTEKIRLSNGTAKGISCHFWDVGGQEKLRPLWKSYSRCTDGIIYVVDSVDVDRLEEAKTELHKVTKFAENQGTPLLVIANKQDLPKSLPVADIEKQLALHELAPSTTYHVQPACAIIGEGLHEGMDKLYEMIVKRRKSLKQKKKQRSLPVTLTENVLQKCKLAHVELLDHVPIAVADLSSPRDQEVPPSSGHLHGGGQEDKVHDESGHKTLTIHLQQSLQRNKRFQTKKLNQIVTPPHSTSLLSDRDILPLALNFARPSSGDQS